ncbi:MAG: DUF3089 domain-containing protein [Acidimicrobiales bacterium]
MRSPIRSLVAVVALLSALGACSSDGDAPTTSASTDTTSTTTPATPLERYADYRTVSYDDPSHWVCRPDIDDDICDGDLDATHVAEDGTLTVEPFVRADDPPIDCFYVYPTISRDTTAYSDWDLSDEQEGFVTLNQAARLQSQCRLFAPGYRQLTLGGLGSLFSGEPSGEEGDPFADVLDAFETYMAEDNGGRGFVLIGHSQGAGMLNQLIRTEIDPNEDVRDLLVGAYLAGGAVTVPDGEIVGGDFQHVPLCEREGEVGCVITWATFRSTAPPPASSFFGRPRGGGGVAGCVNPAAPGKRSTLDSYFTADAEASIFAPGDEADEATSWIEPSAGEIETPFVHVDDLVTGECTALDGFRYLEATITGAGDGPRADDVPGDLSPDWGLHLVDINLVMGDVVRNVAAQAEAFAGG